jgi:hypothetical protein
MGSARSLFNELVISIPATDSSIATAATEGIGNFDRLDVAGEDNALHDVCAIVDIVAATGLTEGTGTLVLRLQHADDNGSGAADTWSNCTASTEVQVGGPTVTSISGQVSSGAVTVTSTEQASTAGTYLFGYLGDKRHVRVTVQNTDATTAFTGGITVTYLGANPRDMIR